MSSVVGGWFLHDQAGATEYAIAHADDADFGDALAALALGFYTANLRSEAREYFDRLPTDAARRLIFEELRESWTFDWGDMREQRTDPHSLTDWITQFPVQYWQGTLGPRLEFWAKEDLNDLLGWLMRQTPEVRYAVASDFQVPRDTSLEETARLIFNLADPNLRERLLPALFEKLPQ